MADFAVRRWPAPIPKTNMPTTPFPHDLQQFWDDLEAADRRAAELSARLTDEEFFWQPDEGRRWSVPRHKERQGASGCRGR